MNDNDKQRDRMRKYREEHRAEYNEYYRNYYKAHKEAVTNNVLRWRARNEDRYRESRRIYERERRLKNEVLNDTKGN